MKLIENCTSWYKLWSIRLAAVAGVMTTAIISNYQFFLGLIASIPNPWRTLVAVGAGVIVFVLPAWTRLVKQPKLAADGDGNQA